MKPIRVALIALALCFVAFVSGRKTAPQSTPVVKTDTLTICETKWAEKPVYITNTIIRHDTLFCYRTDTVNIHTVDTVLVPISQKYYSENDGRLRIWISGYKPSLDRWELDEETRVVKNTVQKRWGVNVGVGTAVIYTPFHKCPVDAGFGIIGGITYTF